MRDRFAPSPTGYLHLGHAFSALTCWDGLKTAGGTFLLRIEDIDIARAKPEFEAAIFRDLAWLGIEWARPVMRQSERFFAYDTALNRLINMGLCYPCGCSRRDISEALRAPQETRRSAAKSDAIVYPGTCRARPMSDRRATDALRLDLAKAIDHLGGDAAVSALSFLETGPDNFGRHQLSSRLLTESCGDVVLARRDIGTSYHLVVVVDDAAQNITHVTRGQDMFAASYIHRLLQALLDLAPVSYHHHRLIRDASGRRLAKRDEARALHKLRAEGASPRDIRAMVGL